MPEWPATNDQTGIRGTKEAPIYRPSGKVEEIWNTTLNNSNPYTV